MDIEIKCWAGWFVKPDVESCLLAGQLSCNCQLCAIIRLLMKAGF